VHRLGGGIRLLPRPRDSGVQALWGTANGEPRTVNRQPLVVAGVAPNG